MTAVRESDGLEDKQLGRLRTELKARTAEAAWLKAHYSQHLVEARRTIEALSGGQRVAATPAPPADQPARPAPVDPEKVQLLQAQIDRLQAEVERLQAAEQRYLDRIKELKDVRAR